ncbi:MAG TPA: S8 family serine peptidase [Steroidobacteraceae bacterium]|nr:S8 family serine peptidase [Steroidobacteraceae bacterium]
MTRACLAIACAAWLAACAAVPAGVTTPPLPAAVRAEPERYLLVTVANRVAALPSRAGSTLRGYDAAAVGYRVSSQARMLANTLAIEYGLRQVSAWPIATLRVHCLLYEVPPGRSRDALLARLAADPRVELAQPLHRFSTSAGRYNDPYFGLQRSFRDMSLAAAHQWSDGDGATVAVIDTGVDTGHPDLAGRIRRTRNFVDADRAQFLRDRHGTAVAGIIAAVGNNGQGIVGVAPRVDVVAFKACWQLADATAACNSFTLALGLAAAIDARVDVINLSLVGPFDPLLVALTQRATERGIVVVGAVPENGRMDGFPAGAPTVLPVDMAEHVSQAPTALHAPGREVLTLTPQGHYDFQSGSSLATAGVSGVVALLRARNPLLSPADVHDVLTNATRELHLTDGPALRSINACIAVSAVVANAQCSASGESATALPVARD